MVVRTNRYGMQFAENKSARTYKSSGRSFASYYRLACTRCGCSFAGPRWESHNTADCDSVIKQEKRGDFSAFGLRDLKLKNLHGIE